MVRIGKYGINRDSLNWILTTWGTKEKFLQPGEVPREVKKTEHFYSKFGKMVEQMHEYEMAEIYEECKDLKELAVKAMENLWSKIQEAEIETDRRISASRDGLDRDAL